MACGVLATAGPGMLFGLLLFVVGRLGRRPKFELGKLLPAVIGMLIVVDLIAFGFGAWVRNQWVNSGTLMLPAFLFPELRADLIWAQSVNLAAYLVMSCAAVGLLIAIYLYRGKLAK